MPFMVEVGLPGDTFDIRLDARILTHPTLGPLFGSYKLQLDVFEAPIRLYNALLHNNKLGIGMHMDRVKLPQIKMIADEASESRDGADLDNSQVNPSCVLKYLGISGAGYVRQLLGPRNRYFNGTAWLAYWEIYKNYYANKQEGDENGKGAVVHSDVFITGKTVELFEVNGNIFPQSPNTNQQVLGLGSGRTIQIVFSVEADANESQLDNIRVNMNAAGSAFKTLRELFQGEYTINSVDGIIQGSVSPSYGLIAIYSWDYMNNYTPRFGKPQVYYFPLNEIDDMRELILRTQSEVNPFIINEGNTLRPYRYINRESGVNHLLNSQEGLAIKTYQSDLFNNWLNTEWIDGVDGITEITAVDVSDGVLKIDDLNLAKKVYDMLNRIAVSGGSFDDYIDAVWGGERYRRAESPIYHGGLSSEVIFQEVVSNSGTSGDGGSQPLGTIAGRGTLSQKRKGGNVTIHVNEPSYILGIVSLTPRVDYSQGNRWDTGLQTLEDLHKPSLDQIGFQDLVIEQAAWWTTSWDPIGNRWVQKAAGKQPAWVNYMTNYNRTYGNFAVANNEMFMTLNRRYDFDWDTEEIYDMTTYVNPSKFNFIFAETASDAQNFWAQIAVDIEARRKMSAKVMPNL